MKKSRAFDCVDQCLFTKTETFNDSAVNKNLMKSQLSAVDSYKCQKEMNLFLFFVLLVETVVNFCI